MPDTPHPLTDARLRVDRAREHLDTLRQLAREFEREQEQQLRVQPLNPAGDFAFSLPTSSLIPAKANILVGEIVYNLRAALDYLIWVGALVSEGHEVDGTQFPLDDDPAVFESRVKSAAMTKGYLAGVPEETVKRMSRSPWNFLTAVPV